MIVTQTEQVLRMLKKQPLTSLEAIKSLNCMRLAARINDLKNNGYRIETKMINNNGKRYAEYRLIK